MKNISVLLVGTGMYACGRGTDGYGTVLPALFEWNKNNRLGSICIAGTSPTGLKDTKKRADKLLSLMGAKASICYFPAGPKRDKKAYLKAIKEIPRPACAIIAVPDNLHREIAGRAVEAGFHTLVVKPLAPTVKEVKELVQIQKRSKVYCAVEFHKRFDLANLKLRDTIAEGKIGDPLYFVVEYSQRKSVPSERFIKWVKTTNVFQYLGIHYVDIIHFVTKATPKRAMAVGQKGWLASKGIDTYDSIQGVIEWEMPSGKKFSSHILTNWIDPEKTSAMSDQKIKVIGTKGRIESDQKGRGLKILSDEKGIEEPNPYFCSAYGREGHVSYHGYGIESIHQFLKDVVRIENKTLKIKDLQNKRPTFENAVLPTAVLEAINKSLASDSKCVTIHGV